MVELLFFIYSFNTGPCTILSLRFTPRFFPAEKTQNVSQIYEVPKAFGRNEVKLYIWCYRSLEETEPQSGEEFEAFVFNQLIVCKLLTLNPLTMKVLIRGYTYYSKCNIECTIISLTHFFANIYILVYFRNLRVAPIFIS